MKIAFIGQKGIPAKSGGVDRHVESLAIFLVKKGNEVTVYNRRGYLKENISQWQGVNLVHLPFIDHKNLAAITHGFLATVNAIKKRVDVIHYHGIGPALLAWIPRLFAPKIRVVTTLHSFDYGNDKWGGFAKFMLKLGESSMCRFSHEVIVLTDLMRDYLMQRYNRESMVIPNGSLVKPALPGETLKSFNLESKKYIVSVSRIIRLKGIQYLIEAFKAVNPDDVKLVIVGDGEYKEELEKLANNDPKIIFTGNQEGEALNELYSNARLFVQSSELEGLSISLLEAMAHGLPCLTSDIVANREASADTSLYFESKNTKNLEDKLRQIINDSEELDRLGQTAKTRAQNKFNWDKISNDIIEVYNKTVKK